ncbi:peptidoglycan DD-metalloendopeptidase family protein [Myxococcota bacterium]
MRLFLRLILPALFLVACQRHPPPDILTPVPDAEAVGVFHQVRAGETLFSICKSYQADLQEVAEINGITDADQLEAGQKVFIPDVETAVPGEKPAKTAEKKVAIKKWTGQFIWPVDGVLTSKFGIRGGRRHDGIDIGAPQGTEIVAAADGTVLYSGDQQTGYGNLIIIKHANDMITVYAHNQKNLVKESDQVKRGQAIGKVGRTGRATGPHLHFEIRKRTHPRNPLFFLPKPP